MKQIILLLTFAALLATVCIAQKPKPTTRSGSSFDVIIEKDGTKTEIKSSQFQSADGTAVVAEKGRLSLTFGASNDINDKNISFSGWVPSGATGTFTSGDGSAGFSFLTSIMSNVPIFTPEKGATFEITSAPTMGGFVVGTFSGVCKNITDGGTIETYNVSGSFKLARH